MDLDFVAKLEQTLVQATSPDSAVLKKATEALSNDFYNEKNTLPAIIYLAQNSSNELVKKIAAVEGRKLTDRHWESLDASTKKSIKDTILASTFNESSKHNRHQLARIIAAIAVFELEDNSWAELLPVLVNGATDASNVSARETSTFVLLTLLESQIAEVGQHIQSFLELFAKTVQDSESREVRVNSVLGLGAAASTAESYIDTQPQLAQTFQSTIPSMVEVLKEIISSADSDLSKDVFNSFNDLLLLDAKFLGDNLVPLVQIMLEVAINTEIDEEIRVFAIQFLSSATTFRKTKISGKKLGKDITLAALKIASEEIDVEAELEKTDDDNENEESEPNSLALRLIAIASTELPPSQVVSTIFEQLNGLLGSQNKFERRAGLLAIGAAVTGAPDYYTTHIQRITNAIVAGLKDAELVVRASALRSLASLTSELQELLSEQYEVLLPLIIEIIDSATNSNVYKYACISLDTLIEFMSIDAVGKYLEPLMNKLFHMLQVTEDSRLRSIIVSAIGSTAYAAGTGFIPYFSKSVEILEPFILNAASVEGLSEDDIELRALTFENISTMARAVGSESFSQFAKPLVDAAYTSIKSESSRLRESGYAFISNMAKVYRKEFAPFLPNIVPEIFNTLKQEEFNMNFGEDEEEDFDEDEINDKFQVHTGITIEKEIAAIALSELALGTQELFAPYLEESVKVLSEQVTESYGMREAALTSLWKVVEAILSVSVQKQQYPKGVPSGSYVDANVLSLIQHAREITLTTLSDEFELSMVAAVLDNVSELIKRYGPIIIIDNGDSSSLENLCVGLMNLLKGEHPCQTLDDDEDPEDEDADASESDALLLESTLEVLVHLAAALGPDFTRIFDSFKATVISNVKSNSKNKRVFATGALAEIALGLKEANPYSEELLQLFLERLENDKSVEVRGNAAYGVGIIVYYASANYSSIYPNIFNLLSKLLTKIDKQEASVEEDDEETKDVIHRSYANASGCVARLALKQQDVTPLNAILPTLVSHLPLESAFEENTPIFELIIRLYQSDNSEIVQFTPKLIEAFATVFLKEAEREKLEKESTLGREENIDRFKQFQTEELKAQVVELLKFLESKYSGSVSQNEVLAKVIA